MSKKKKIIISVTAAVLVLAMVLTCVAVVIGNKNDTEREREEYEQAQNANNNQDTNDPADTTTPDTDIPPVIVPDDTGDETVKDDIILDVNKENRDPNPEVKDATIEYDNQRCVYIQTNTVEVISEEDARALIDEIAAAITITDR